ncbi:2-hydroxychromene-2-carboxylate isomerase [Rhodovulum sulfidophilum]|uniref:2-hydroxychromene-2-carboxylate isomerase n=1 Tax=Rhodovulum sulfidophilum TaxID=35806 RepID=UPI0005A7E220|nr:2-hydroxychromene-2-carboxylate isomerase [Rhodovulum sulfidophilum]ANB33678.1 2-hydroxychromene-2-carboxylate isomerase [Rhodovulum sulfidophilum DSM 1374]ANB37499.1 2-hydroxychromene-2-carboxylate isomerase [Rhodovulum sulfidophilum]MCW2302974.1 2-hydroxychromene-2-carboxylate isomerase [Rhodovulum sulfidophilum]
MAHIDYFFTVISPYAYLAGNRLEEIAARHGATVTYKPVDMMALFGRTGGTPLPQRAEARKAYRLQELRRQSVKTGLKLSLAPAHFPTNPAPAAYAIIAAQATGEGDPGQLVHALTRACWAEDRNVAEDEVIRDCLKAAGFDPGLADRGLLAGAETYAANLEEATARGVFGAPFYITDGDERFWGQDRLDDLDQHLAGKL